MARLNNDSLRIAINAQFLPGTVGGIETAVTELIAALGRLAESDSNGERYVIVGAWQNHEWLRPFTTAAQEIISCETPRQASPVIRKLRTPLAPLRPLVHRMRAAKAAGKNPLISPDVFNNAKCDVVHFAYQDFAACEMPSVFSPHDLLHLHYPQFFAAAELRRREAVYRAGCETSHTVVVASQWVKDDVVRHYGVAEKKVQVISWAAPRRDTTEMTAAMLAGVQAKYTLDAPFALYPAATWEHKNHLRLLDAVARLRDEKGITMKLICTGEHTPFFKFIEKRLGEKKLQSQVLFPGIVPLPELRALYRLAEFVIIPTLFEAASAPLFEAWAEGAPVACAAVTSLPEQAGDAALMFDSCLVAEIAGALQLMHEDAALRSSLVERGYRRQMDFSWERTARAYRAVYKRAAGKSLSTKEEEILAWNWTRESNKPQRDLSVTSVQGERRAAS